MTDLRCQHESLRERLESRPRIKHLRITVGVRFEAVGDGILAMPIILSQTIATSAADNRKCGRSGVARSAACVRVSNIEWDRRAPTSTPPHCCAARSMRALLAACQCRRPSAVTRKSDRRREGDRRPRSCPVHGFIASLPEPGSAGSAGARPGQARHLCRRKRKAHPIRLQRRQTQPCQVETVTISISKTRP